MSVIKWVWPGCQSVSAKSKLISVRRLACFGITGALRTAPSNVVEAHFCLPTLELLVQIEAMSAVHRLCGL